MKFDEALHRFRMELMAEYDIEQPIVKIAVTPELFDRAILELMLKCQYKQKLTTSNEVYLEGIQILTRDMYKF